jgi:hypothetical protein
LSGQKAALWEKLKVTITQQDREAEQQRMAEAAIRRLQELMAPINSELKAIYPQIQIDSGTDEMTRNIVRSHAENWGKGRCLLRSHRCTLLAPFGRRPRPSFRMSRSVEFFEDGELALTLMIHVGLEGTMGNIFHWQPPATFAPAGSIQVEKMLEDAIEGLKEAVIEGLKEAVKDGLTAFADQIPGADS